MNYLLLELDRGNVVMLAFPDLWAAFDMVDHEILVNRLKTDYGFADDMLRWLKSSLSGQTQ